MRGPRAQWNSLFSFTVKALSIPPQPDVRALTPMEFSRSRHGQSGRSLLHSIESVNMHSAEPLNWNRVIRSNEKTSYIYWYLESTLTESEFIPAHQVEHDVYCFNTARRKTRSFNTHVMVSIMSRPISTQQCAWSVLGWVSPDTQ